MPSSILYIVSSWPCGRSFGGQIRSYHIGCALKEVGPVSVLMVGADADDAEARELTSREFTVLPPIKPVLRPNRGVVEKLRWAVDPNYLNLHGFVAPEADQRRVLQYRQEHALTWVLNSRTANILQIPHWPGAHLDIDDIPSTYLRSRAASDLSAIGRLKSRVQQGLWRRRELRFKQRFTTVSVCSDEDRRYLNGGDTVHVIPNGFARPAKVPVRSVDPHHPRIGFVGLYSYAPNREGVRWFLRECWPAIQRAIPGVRFRLMGKDTNGPDAPSDLGVDALGWVADPAEEISTWSAMVIPIRFGGGTRIKIADAFSRKCPVVSTSLGAFGYAVEDGRQLRLADEPAAFAQACIDLARKPAEGNALAERAWSEFLDKWTWDAIAPRVRRAAEDCLQRKG